MIDECYIGDVRDGLQAMIDAGLRAQTCVTSPPYWGLRDYGADGQIGLESSPAEYVAAMVEVFRLVGDVLADDGTLWLNMGDSYAGQGGLSVQSGKEFESRSRGRQTICRSARARPVGVLKTKDLVGMPWRVAFALQADGWYLRQDIIWSKPNPMPESVTDRCTKAHEYLFLLSKNSCYFWDAAAMQEPAQYLGPNGAQQSPYGQGFARRSPEEELERRSRKSGNKQRKTGAERGCPDDTGSNVCGSVPWEGLTRNKRSVWTVTSQPYADAHFATFPPALIEPCILAGSRPGDIVLDPFMGSGTTAMVAQSLGRRWLGCELNPAYVAMQKRRAAQTGLELHVLA